MHEVLVNRLGGLSLPRKSVVRLTDRPDMTLDVYRGRKTTMQQRLSDVNVCQCCQYSLMLLSICENAQQTYSNINECLTAHSLQTCQRELQFALVNPCLSIDRHFVSPHVDTVVYASSQ